MSRRYSFDEPDSPGERVPLDNPNDSYSQTPTHQQYQDRPQDDDVPSSPSARRRSYASPTRNSAPRSNHPAAHPDSTFNTSRRNRASYVAPASESAPAPPPHRSNRQSWAARDSTSTAGAHRHSTASNITPGADNFGDNAAGGMSGLAYGVADRNARQSGVEAMSGYPQEPPYGQHPNYPYPQAYQRSQNQHPAYDQPGDYGYYGQGNGSGYGGHSGRETATNSSHSVGAVVGGAGFPSGRNTPTRSTYSYSSDPFQDPNMAYQNRTDPSLGQFNPNEIDDDGDDGLDYRRPGRNSMLNPGGKDRHQRSGAGAAAGLGGLMGSNRSSGANYDPVHNASSGYAGAGGEYDLGSRPEKAAALSTKSAHSAKKKRLIIIIVIALVIAAGIVGGVVGGVLNQNDRNGDGGNGLSAEDDMAQNGDLGIDSSEIKALMGNSELHKVFPGVDYTPLNVQYPECVHNPPSQNNVTRDVAVLSQLTDTIRLYGTDCNQTQMVIHALQRLKLDNEVKLWMGVWQDKNQTTNKRQLEQMWTILDDYGDSWFKGVIVANEILFREEMTLNELGNLMDDVRQNLTSHGWGSLHVATSDLGDDWTAALGKQSDYIMSNIHPFFAGVTAAEAASWTWSFWENQNKAFWKNDEEMNIISEIGWPTQGGKNCGSATTCAEGSVASIDGLNTLLDTWVCEALNNGTNYFWFEMFDEPWKVRFNEPAKNKEWEDQWGIMDVNRKLKPGVKIPSCGGKTVADIVYN